VAAIAIIGMACRLPGAATPKEFWDNLCCGVESIAVFTDEELRRAGVPEALLQDAQYVKAAPVLRDIETFDAGFFEYSPREAALMDPQQRLFLEVAWEAFEDAGYAPDSGAGVVGVFAGGGGVVTSYFVAQQGNPALAGQTASLPHLGNDKDFLATRVSYKLNLTGPSITVQTACSTSLVAVHLACQSVATGESDMALAGASTIRIPHRVGYLAEKGNVYSLDELPRLRRQRTGDDFWERGGGGAAEGSAAGHRRPRPHLRRHQGHGGQQRRRTESQLHRPERHRPGAGICRGVCSGRRYA
jgi:acyl transferase domain-containing protein